MGVFFSKDIDSWKMLFCFLHNFWGISWNHVAQRLRPFKLWEPTTSVLNWFRKSGLFGNQLRYKSLNGKHERESPPSHRPGVTFGGISASTGNSNWRHWLQKRWLWSRRVESDRPLQLDMLDSGRCSGKTRVSFKIRPIPASISWIRKLVLEGPQFWVTYPDTQYTVYLPTFGHFLVVNEGKYNIHWVCGISIFYIFFTPGFTGGTPTQTESWTSKWHERGSW